MQTTQIKDFTKGPIAKELIIFSLPLFFSNLLQIVYNMVDMIIIGNHRINFVTAILDGIVLRIGLSVLFGLVPNMKHFGFWLGDALAGFTPFWIGLVFYLTGHWKKGRMLPEKETDDVRHE